MGYQVWITDRGSLSSESLFYYHLRYLGSDTIWLFVIVKVMKKILLTGGSSYLGSKFIELYGNDYDILGLSRASSTNPVDMLDFEKVKQTFRDFKPDYIIHTAADIGRDESTAQTITHTNPAITKNLVELARESNIPFIFTSTEAVYGGKEDGGYKETDKRIPRSPYGESKVLSEDIVMHSGLPNLIIRGHRFVGINKNYRRKKQFPDAIKALTGGQKIHCDSIKLFRPTLINNICATFNYYIANDSDKQILLNLGVDKVTTWYNFMQDVANTIGLDKNLVVSDGKEAGWPSNSALDVSKVISSGYPYASYDDALIQIKKDYS